MSECGMCGIPIPKNELDKFLHSTTHCCRKCAYNELRFPHEFGNTKQHPVDLSKPTWGIEFEGNPDLATFRRWYRAGGDCVKDGSLRGRAIEFVSPILTEADLEEWIHKAFDNAKAVLCNRQGLHVHVNAPSWNWFDHNLALYNARNMQGLFAQFVSPSREMTDGTDRSGRPIKIPPIILCKSKSDYIHFLYGRKDLRSGYNEEYTNKKGKRCARRISLMRHSKRANDLQGRDEGHYPGGIIHRYWFINFHRWFNNKCIEWRGHQSTVDPEKIINWCRAVRIWTDWLPTRMSPGSHPLDPLPTHLHDYYSARIKYYASLRPSKMMAEDMSMADMMNMTPEDMAYFGVFREKPQAPRRNAFRNMIPRDMIVHDVLEPRFQDPAPVRDDAMEREIQRIRRREAVIQEIQNQAQHINANDAAIRHNEALRDIPQWRVAPVGINNVQFAPQPAPEEVIINMAEEEFDDGVV